jgi:molybdate transport system substrate-binding protein
MMTHRCTGALAAIAIVAFFCIPQVTNSAQGQSQSVTQVIMLGTGMKNWGRRRIVRAMLATILGLPVVCMDPAAADAAEIKVLTARAVATVLDKIGPAFERETGHKLNVISGFGPVFVRQINAGEPFDVFVSTTPTMEALFKEGKLVADTRTNLVRSRTGVEVRAGASKPDVGSVEAFKRALLDAKSTGYLGVGGVPQLVERLGIADAIRSKVTIPDTDTVSELVAKGELELGVVVITQILTTPGVELVGPLPPEIQFHTVFVAGVSADSKVPDAARDLIKYLKGPKAIPVIESQGMEPG